MYIDVFIGCHSNMIYNYYFRRFLEEDFVWRVMYQLLLALNECHKTRECDGGKVSRKYVICRMCLCISVCTTCVYLCVLYDYMCST